MMPPPFMQAHKARWLMSPPEQPDQAPADPFAGNALNIKL
jgi:hypothetical protein